MIYIVTCMYPVIKIEHIATVDISILELLLELMPNHYNEFLEHISYKYSSTLTTLISCPSGSQGLPGIQRNWAIHASSF